MKIIIPGELPTLNKYVDKERANKYGGATLKRKATSLCAVYCRVAKNQGLRIVGKVDINLHWYVKNRRQDKDNIRFAIKFIQDGMMAAGLIENDGWQQIGDYHDTFSVDKENPRVEIEFRKHETRI